MKHDHLNTLLITAILSMAGTALLWGLWVTGNFENPDRLLLDQAQQQIPPQPVADSPLVYIKIGDISDQPWPWQSLDYAILTHSILRYSPKLVVMETPFVRTDGSPTVYDIQLKRQLKRLNSSIVSVPVTSSGRHLGRSTSFRPLATLPESLAIPPYGYGLWPIEQVADTAQLAPQAFPADPDGIVRKIPLIINYQGQPVASQILRAYASYIGADLADSGAIMGKSIVLKNSTGAVMETIPINTHGEITLRYHPSAELPVRKEVEFYSVILASEQQHQEGTPSFDLGVLRNSLVVLGKEHPNIMEPIPTPTGPLSPAKLQITALSNLIHHSYIKFVSPTLMIFLLYLTIAMGILIARFNNIWLSLSGLVVGVVYTAAMIALIFYFQGYWLAPTALMLAPGLGWLAGRLFTPYLSAKLTPSLSGPDENQPPETDG